MGNGTGCWINVSLQRYHGVSRCFWRHDRVLRDAPLLPKSRIPMLIHQMWRDESSIPPLFEAYRETWQRHHPQWRVVLWTDADIGNMLHDTVPWVERSLRGLDFISMIDTARYVVLHRYGGLYVDMDVEAFRSIEPLLHGASLLLTDAPADPSLMASEAQHPFWMWMLHRILHRRSNEVFEVTGPWGLQYAVDDYLAKTTAHVPGITTFDFDLYQLSRLKKHSYWTLMSNPCHRSLCEPLYRSWYAQSKAVQNFTTAHIKNVPVKERWPYFMGRMFGYHHCTQSWNTKVPPLDPQDGQHATGSVSLIQQLGSAACVLHKSFGCVEERGGRCMSMWVQDCRGAFRCGYKRSLPCPLPFASDNSMSRHVCQCTADSFGISF